MKTRIAIAFVSLLPLAATPAAPAAAQDGVQKILADGQLQKAYNPVLLDFLLDEGKDALPEADRKKAIDQLVTALKANLDISQGEEVTAAAVELAGQLVGGDTGRTLRVQSQALWDAWIGSADVLLAAGYTDEAGSFYEYCAAQSYLWGNQTTRCTLGLAKAKPDQAFDILMQMATNGSEQRRRSGLRNLGRLAASPGCSEEHKTAIIETLVENTKGLGKATYGAAAVEGLVHTGDPRVVETLRGVSDAGTFSGTDEDARNAARRGLLLTFHDDSVVEKLEKTVKGGMLSTSTPTDQYRAATTLIEAEQEKGYEWALKTLKKKEPGGMFSLSKKGEEDYFGETLWFLVGHGGERAKQVFAEAIDKGKGKDQRKALLAIGLARLGDGSQLERVRKALGEEKWPPAYRWQAAVALARHDDFSGIPVLDELASKQSSFFKQVDTEDLRADVAWALGQISHPDCVPILLRLLGDDKASTRLAAVEALLDMKDPAALPGLEAALGVDFGKTDLGSRNPVLYARIVRLAALRFPDQAGAVVQAGTGSDFLSVRFLSLLEKSRLGSPAGS